MPLYQDHVYTLCWWGEPTNARSDSLLWPVSRHISHFGKHFEWQGLLKRHYFVKPFKWHNEGILSCQGNSLGHLATARHALKAERIQIKWVCGLCVMSNSCPGGLPVTALPRALRLVHTHQHRNDFLQELAVFMYQTWVASVILTPNLIMLLNCRLYATFMFLMMRLVHPQKVSAAPTDCAEIWPRYLSHMFWT